jgi:beta-fructofuranosidase
MVCGGNLNGNKGGESVVNVYRTDNDELTKWTYLGVLFKHPDADVKNIECPIFFKVDARWVLIVSQGQPVDWFVGDLDESTMHFTPKTRGKVDYGQVYAPSVLAQGVDRPILWGWINGVPGGRGWRHCQTLPRRLSIDADGRLMQSPPRETERLTANDATEARDVTLDGVGRLTVDALEVLAVFETGPDRKVAFDLESGEASKRLSVTYENGMLDVGGTKAPVALNPHQLLWLTIFVDHSIVEISANHGAAWVTRALDFAPRQFSVQADAHRPVVLRQFEAWTMRSCWVKP